MMENYTEGGGIWLIEKKNIRGWQSLEKIIRKFIL